MKVTVHLEGKDKAELVKQYLAHGALLGVEAGKPGKTAKPVKEETEEEETFEDGSEEETETEENEQEEESEEEETELSLDDVRGALTKAIKSEQVTDAAVRKLIKKFGAEKTPELKKKDYPKVLAELKKLIKAGKAA